MECIQLSELSQVKVRVNLKRIIDENGILKNEISINSLHEVHFTVQLYTNSRPLGAIQNSNFFVPKNLFDEPIIFNCFYQDLSADSKIAISIWYLCLHTGLLPKNITSINLLDLQSSNSLIKKGSFGKGNIICLFGLILFQMLRIPRAHLALQTIKI